jgi:hypothetical protein
MEREREREIGRERGCRYGWVERERERERERDGWVYYISVNV